MHIGDKCEREIPGGLHTIQLYHRQIAKPGIFAFGDSSPDIVCEEWGNLDGWMRQMTGDHEKSNKAGQVSDAIAGVLSSDLALEIKAEFEGRISMGVDVPGATAHVFGKFHSALSSPQEGPVVLVALAALQLREGYLQAVIRNAGLDLIETGEALNAYRSFDAGQRKATREMLEQLSVQLGESPVQDE